MTKKPLSPLQICCAIALCALLGYCAFSPTTPTQEATTQTPYIAGNRDEFGNELKPNVSYSKKQGEEVTQTQETTPEPEVREMGLDEILKDEVKSDASYIYNIMKAYNEEVTFEYNCPPQEYGTSYRNCKKDKHHYNVRNYNFGNVNYNSFPHFTFGNGFTLNVRYTSLDMYGGGFNCTYAEKMQAVRIFASAFKPEYERELVEKLSASLKTLKIWNKLIYDNGAFSGNYFTTFAFHGINISVEYGRESSEFSIFAADTQNSRVCTPSPKCGNYLPRF